MRPTNLARRPKTYGPPTEPGLYWVRMVDPKTLKDYPLAHNERVVRVVRCAGCLIVLDKDDDGYVDSPPSTFACYCWGPPVNVPRF